MLKSKLQLERTPMYKELRPYIFKADPEKAHNAVETILKNSCSFTQGIAARLACVDDARLHNNVAGMDFYHPIGLAAGFDKNATMVKSLIALGFSHVEVGSFTLEAQSGSPKPRIWRHVELSSIQNAMGFNNKGASVMAKNLKALYPFRAPIGANIGKNKDVSAKDALQNYRAAMLAIEDACSYYTFNLSSPNTKGLRDLQNKGFVGELVAMAREISQKPLFIKLSPDMQTDDMLEVVGAAIDAGISGIIATNTTIDYSLAPHAREVGGLSGGVLCAKSREVFRILGANFYGKTTLISLGGIASGSEALLRIKMGASLVQVLSALVYEGPGLVKKMLHELLALMNEEGFSSIADAIGASVKSGAIYEVGRPSEAVDAEDKAKVDLAAGVQSKVDSTAESKMDSTIERKAHSTADIERKVDSTIGVHSKTDKAPKSAKDECLAPTAKAPLEITDGRDSLLLPEVIPHMQGSDSKDAKPSETIANEASSKDAKPSEATAIKSKKPPKSKKPKKSDKTTPTQGRK